MINFFLMSGDEKPHVLGVSIYPQYFSQMRKTFRINVSTESGAMNIRLINIYKIVADNDRIIVWYRRKDEKSGRVIGHKAEIDESTLRTSLLSFYECELLCKLISAISDAISFSLNKFENPLGDCFKSCIQFRDSKIASIKRQDYEAASRYRDQERLETDKLRKLFRERMGNDKLDEAITYVPCNYKELIRIPAA